MENLNFNKVYNIELGRYVETAKIEGEIAEKLCRMIRDKAEICGDLKYCYGPRFGVKFGKSVWSFDLIKKTITIE